MARCGIRSARRARTPILILMVSTLPPVVRGQPLAPCQPPLCVNRDDDQPGDPLPGTLRYAVQHAAPGAEIRFDPALHGRTIRIANRSPIRIERDLILQGPGAKLLTISGGHATRLFLIAGGTVRIAGLTLADGLAQGGEGGAGSGGAGGGGGGAGMGGSLFISQGALTLDGVVMSGNHAVGGSGGNGGPGLNAGRGGAGGSADPKGEAGGTGGTAAPDGIDGGTGEWGSGGGGGGFRLEDGNGYGGSAGGSDFGGGSGGTGGFLDPDGGSTGGSAGSGGSGMGGAIFISSGLLQLIDTEFVNNSASGGSGAKGASNGVGKGGAIFVCSPSLCGSGHDGAAIWSGKTFFAGNTASDAGGEQSLPGRDDPDVCGYLSSPVPAHLTVLGPPTAAPGESFAITVLAVDAGGNTVQTYTGVVRVTSTDRQAALPADAALSAGVGIFTLTMNTTGMQTVTASVVNAASVTGTSKAIAVNPDGGGGN
jgi:hypothetical protein